MKEVSIVIPAYNEESGIGEVLEQLVQMKKGWHFPCEIIVVDDGSQDRTAAEIRKHDVRLVQHHINRGYGASLKTGIHAAQYDIIVITDADGTYPNERIPELVSDIGEYDMVVGARTGPNVQIPAIRKPIKWILNKYANYLVKYKIPDLNSGLRVIKRSAVERFERILPSGFSFTTTITLAMLGNNYDVKFVPIDYFKRSGRSKIRPVHDTINFLNLITRTSLLFNPLRVYMPLALVMLALAFISLMVDVFIFKNLTDKSTMLCLAGIQIGAVGMLADAIGRRA